MRDGLQIIDADRHVIEPLDLWQAHLPPALRAHAPRIVRLLDAEGAPLPPQPVMDGRLLYRQMSARTLREMAADAARRWREYGPLNRAETHIADMDREGIDVAFLYPTISLFLLALDPLDPALADAFARAYNTWLRGFCDHAPDRLQGVALLSTHDPGGMVAAIDHAVALGFRAVVLRPNPVAGRTLSDPAYEPFWAACEARSLAVTVHEGTHGQLPSAGADRFHTRFALHACSHPMEQMMALLALVEGGVLERHPGLRVAFLEAGCGWVPYWLYRLDEVEHRHLASEVEETVRRAPSRYFRDQCFVGFEPDEPYLPEAIPRIGADNLLFGTDFPHPDADADAVARAVALRGAVPDAVLRKLLADNAARFYGLTP